MKRLVGIAIVSLGLLALPLLADVQGQGVGGRVRVSLSTTPNISLHEPVFLRLVVENRSARQVSFDLGQGRKGNLRFELVGPDGSATKLRRVFQEGVAIAGLVVLQPLEVYEGQYILDEWISLEEAGSYQLRFAIDSVFRTSDAEVSTSEDLQTLAITVGPRDEARLRKLSEGLLQIARNGSTAEIRRNAANGLAYVSDEVAVASMTSLLRQTELFDTAIAEGLARVGTESARAALEEMASSASAERVSTARRILTGDAR